MGSILIVEDDTLMLRMYQKAFGFEGFEAETAADGEEGLLKARANKPTLMLLDIMMPKKNGLEVLSEMKADENLKDVPVVVLTNLAGTQDAETALSKGAVKYIVKSEHDPKEVVDIVKGILAGYTRDEVPEG
jgi:DNA-binding response OmpR family regulator